MTHPLVSRAHLEALVIALAVVRRERRGELCLQVDRTRISPACWALLAQLADEDADTIAVHTARARSLEARVDALTVADLTYFPIDTVVALVNQLPARATAVPAWERDLTRGAGACA